MAGLVEQRLGDVRWLVVSGEREAAFRELGRHAAEDIHAVLRGMADMGSLRRRLDAPATARQFAAVRDASAREFPREWAELGALARGSGASFDELLLLNLRGDLGSGDGTGCTDLGHLSAEGAFVAHNEDGDPVLDGRCALLTLQLHGEPSATVWWYPGFIPANTAVVTEHGLAWGIDHLGVPRPAAAPGRHFVARAAQRLSTVDEAAAHLSRHASAGGFAYTIGQLAGHGAGPSVCTVEAAAGRCRRVDADSAGSLLWHTNHLRYLAPELAEHYDNSTARGEVLSRLAVPDRPDVAWFLSVLVDEELPRGVNRRARHPDSSVTLATVVVDLIAGGVTVAPRSGRPVTLPATDLVRGVPVRQLNRRMS